MATNSSAFLTLDWATLTPPLTPNGCAWYRCVLPSRALKDQGWSTGVGLPAWTEANGFGLLVEETKAISGWDVLVFKLVMLEAVAHNIPIAQAMGQKIVVDIDDFFEGLSPSNHAFKATNPARNAQSNRDHYMRIIDQADALITSTPFLYDFYTAKGKTVFMVRNGIDLDRWSPKQDRAGWMPTIGWVGATPWRSNDLETMTFLNGFMTKHRLPFHHAGYIRGAKSAADQLGLTFKTSREYMQLITGYPKMFRKMDIGLVPLSDIPFNHAKSGIKGLEYAASGVPFIASWSPEYEYLESQGIGRVARSESEWLEHLEALLDPRVRKQDTERNLENIKTHQTMAVRASEWASTMKQIQDL